jgi:hypothetical protein
MKKSEISRPRIPTTIRMIPTVVISMPETDASTAKYRIAPTAMRKSEVPMPIDLRLPSRRSHEP